MKSKAPVCKGESVGEYVEDIAASLPPDDTIVDLAEFLQAFGDSSRIRVTFFQIPNKIKKATV